jgi:hypothetical protein
VPGFVLDDILKHGIVRTEATAAAAPLARDASRRPA